MKCVFPGSFDQFHDGHLDIIKRASKIFDKVYIIVAQNPNKKKNDFQKNALIIKNIIEKNKFNNVYVDICKNIIPEKMKELDCKIILRSFRSNQDVDFEISLFNEYLESDSSLEEFLMFPTLKYQNISSSQKKQKMFFFDIDGTILNDEKNISNLTSKALSNLNSQGFIVALCTGRTFYQAKKIWEQHKYIKYVIGNSGSTIYDINNDKFYNTNEFVCQQDINLLIEYAKKYRRELSWSDGMNNYRVYFGDNVFDEVKDNLFYIGGSEKKPVYQNWNDVKETLYKGNIVQISIKLESYKVNELYSILKSKLTQNSVLFETSRVYLEVLNKNINKYKGICKLKKILNQENAITYCFGDSLNDYDMIKKADFGIAMGNATFEIKKIASDITLSNNEDGIYYYLLKKGIINE